MEAYKRVAAARAKGRPTGSDFIEHIFDGFVELHGDRRFADDKAIVAGVAMLNDKTPKKRSNGTSVLLIRKATVRRCAR